MYTESKKIEGVSVLKTICLVEDEADLREILALYMEKNNWHVLSCSNVKEARAQLSSGADLWVADLMLPDGSGFEILKEVKQLNPAVPVILISARGESIDRVVGFEIGCDDYVAKPFLPAELIFRIKKQFGSEQQKDERGAVRFGPYIMDMKKRAIFHDDEEISLTSREFDIVQFFLEHRSTAISREWLLKHIWGEDYFGSDRVVDNYVKRIRRKFPELPLETIYGFGYRCNL